MTMPAEEPNGVTDPSKTGADAPSTTAPDAQTGSTTQHPETFPREYVEQLRKEQKDRRLREAELVQQLAERDAKLKAFEDANLSDAEKRDRELAELRTQTVQTSVALRDAQLAYAVAVEATRVGVVDPDAALALLKKDAITWDGNNPTNVNELLTQLKEARPWLAGTPSRQPPPDTGATNASAGVGGSQRAGQPLTVEAVKKMSQAELESRWDEVSAVLASMRK